MIGIISDKAEADAVMEFFQLFKTPWEFYEDTGKYDVILMTRDLRSELDAKLIVIYHSEKERFDSKYEIAIGDRLNNIELDWNGYRFPIFNNILTFKRNGKPVVRVKGSSDAAGIEIEEPHRKILRLGYNLFEEVSFLLSSGQPPEYAHIPTLEIHISMLRDWILKSGIPLIEIPPVPAGYDFITCLTHDVDFAGIRNHRFDNTMFGFIYRALFGSLIGVLKGKNSWDKLLKNWKAVLSLPAVHLGVVEDFWFQFSQYRAIEKDLGSTFFFMPFKARSGKARSGQFHNSRASKYDITDIKSEVQDLVAEGCEVGLHGIDAWDDSEKGQEELQRVASVTGNSKVGVRMHWLYFDRRSAELLDQAGFAYDSTLGYNDAVGYWGGTLQAFRPPGAVRLLDLPLHIQDTALFYKGRMGLSENEAFELCKQMIQNSLTYGGVLVVNWHQRSLAPERLWGDFYSEVLQELKRHKVWFATARDAVKWFLDRRSIFFKEFEVTEGRVKLKLGGYSPDQRPGLLLRIHRPTRAHPGAVSSGSRTWNSFDLPLEHKTELDIML